MKSIILSAILVGSCATAIGANFSLITEAQSYVTGALDSLRFEIVPSGVVGGPQKYRVTQATVNHMQKLMRENRSVIVQNDGSIKIQ